MTGNPRGSHPNGFYLCSHQSRWKVFNSLIAPVLHQWVTAFPSSHPWADSLHWPTLASVSAALCLEVSRAPFFIDHCPAGSKLLCLPSWGLCVLFSALCVLPAVVPGLACHNSLPSLLFDVWVQSNGRNFSNFFATLNLLRISKFFFCFLAPSAMKNAINEGHTVYATYVFV